MNDKVLSNNQQNRDLYNNDEDVFDRDRNRLGAGLILKGRDNIASGNEPYSDKLLTYAH